MSIPQRSVWLDVQGTQNRAHFDRGIPRFVLEQARALVELAPDAVRAVAVNPARPLTGNLSWLLGSELLTWGDRRGGSPRPLPRVFHAMSPFELDRSLEELWPAWARRPEVATVVTLFDLIPLVFADHYLRDPALRSRYLARCDFIRGADQVLAISQTTADDAVARLGIDRDRVTVVDAGVSNHFAQAFGTPGEAERIVRRRLPGVESGFMLYVAGIEFRKNIERLIEAHGLTSAAFRSRHQLVIACRTQPDEAARLRGCATAAGLAERDLILTNYVTDSELAALYRTCELFVFASFYEGSGLPILEAMACDVPVAASNTSTSPEILGDLEATFDPFDPADMARVLEETLGDPELLERLRRRSRERVGRYTWRGVAERSLEGYATALDRHTRRTRPRPTRSRIAFYTPWPPDRSGIATYNRRLFAELGRTVDIDVVVGGVRATYPQAAETGVRIVGADEMRWSSPLRAHDRTVYCMGNSDFHGYVYEALRQRPGAVVAHDVRLTGFYGWYAGCERPEDPVGRLSERIDALYGSRLGGGLFADRPPTPDEQAALGIYMSHEIQEFAEKLLVHSRFAADVMRLDRLPERRVDAKVSVLPLAFPDRPRRLATPCDPKAPLVVSFGIVSSVKNPQVLLEAFALLGEGRPGARLVFAGHGDPAELDRWRVAARELGIEDRVELPGHVDEAAYAALLERADVAVQMRLVSNGEASAAVTDCLAAGVPTAVTDEGWSAELPEDAVVRIPRQTTATALSAELAGVVDDPKRASELGDAAYRHAQATTFASVARSYLEWLELG